MKKENNDWLNELRRERLQGSARNPGVAALMSFFLMGMGQIYAGHIDRGIMLLAMHLSGLFAAVSVYTGGMVYKTFFPFMGAHLLVILCYMVSVFFILLWIYNIKDAYYLALFSSFRDWFEVERVLLPMLQPQRNALLTDASTADTTELLETSLATETPDVKHKMAQFADGLKTENDEQHVDADVVEVQGVNHGASETDEPGDIGIAADSDAYYSGLSQVSKRQHSWKLYLGFAAILMLVGLWVNKERNLLTADSSDSLTLFAVSANLGETRQNSLIAPALKNISMPTTATVPTLGNAEPATIVVPFIKGLELAAIGKFAEAAESFNAELKYAEPSIAQWKPILNAFNRADLKIEYEHNLRRFLSIAKSDADGWFSLGKLLYDRNELAEGAQAIVNGLKYDTENLRGNFLLGSIYSDLKLYEDAIVFLQRVVNLEPLNIEFNRLLARALVAAGRSDDAARYLQRVLSIAPDDSEARLALIVAGSGSNVDLQVPGDDENSVLVVQGKKESRLVEKNLNSDFPAAVSGKVLYESSVPDSNHIPEEIITGRNMAKSEKPLFVSEKEVAENRPLKIEVAKIPANAGISNAEAGLAAKQKMLEQSQTAGKDVSVEAGDHEFRDFVAEENTVEMLRQKGSSEFSRGNWEGALPFYLKILKQKKDAQAYDMVGLIFEKLSMAKDALAAFEHAYQLGQRDSGTLAKLGRLSERVGDRAKGEFYLYHALQKMPGRIDLRIRYASCLAANGKSDEALGELQGIIASSPDSYAIRRRAEMEIVKIKSMKKR